jgi:hypothetical protein
MKKNTQKQSLKPAKTAFYFQSVKSELALSVCPDPPNSSGLTPTTGSAFCTVL